MHRRSDRRVLASLLSASIVSPAPVAQGLGDKWTVVPVGGAAHEQTRARYPGAEGYAERDGQRIFYEVYGDGGPAVNVHAAWRMAPARRAVQVYAGNAQLAALTVAGSVGMGRADRFSDLELDCYWFSAPGDLDRTAPIQALGGELTALWDYDQDEEEWRRTTGSGSLT
jgi:hypothetical protein